MKKLFASALCALTLAAAILPVSVQASNINSANGNGNTPVLLDLDAPHFDVTVPTGLPIYVDSEGVVTTADDVYIINSSAGSITISGVEISGKNGWTTVDVSKDFSVTPVDTKEFSMTINGETTTGADSITFNSVNWPMIAAANDSDTDQFHLVYDATVAPQSTAVTTDIADVVFTVGWNLDGQGVVSDGNASSGSVNTIS